MTGKDYVLPSSEAECSRLERQARLYGGLEFLRPFLATRPRTVLEVGCGTGIFTRQAAQALGDGSVTGLDMDAGRLAFARTNNSAANVRYEQGDLLALPFEDDAFDLVFCRFVLVHDGIWFSPEKPAFARLLGAALQVMRDRGMEPSQGLHLASGMIRAGLQGVRARVIAHQALAPDPALEDFRSNWVETVTGLAEILDSSFPREWIEEATQELLRRSADEFLVELTVLADGVK